MDTCSRKSRIEDCKELMRFLKNRETDIAFGMEDFGQLRPVFKGIFKREARTAP